MNLIEGPAQQASELAQRVRSGASITIASIQGKTLLLHETARELGDEAVVVQVPRDLDKTAYVLLAAAAQCGEAALQRIAARLSAHQADPSAALEELAAVLGPRRLLVDDLDALKGSAADGELRKVFAPALEKVSAWLTQHASVVTQGTNAKEDVRPSFSGPRYDTRWNSQVMWARVGANVELYTLAVARALLLGVSVDDSSLGWDVTSVVSDLWEGVTDEVRELSAFLAVHGRPIERAHLEALALVPSATITMGIDYNLVEESRGVLRLAAPSTWFDLLSVPARQVRHRRLAEAFARVAEAAPSLDAAPLAVLEAHRHYAAISDIEQARRFARFGVSILLGSAKKMSVEARYDSALYSHAASTYDLVLQLDAQVRAAGDDEGIGSRANAYAIHYRAYNRYKADSDSPPRKTLAEYRRALALWPANALFWSRTISCYFVADQPENGARARDEALDAVAPHPLRGAFLIARTVEHLLRGNRILPAMLIWRDHEPKTPVEWAVEAKLLSRLAQGWTERSLWAPRVTPLAFRTLVLVRITSAGRSFTCHLLGVTASASSPEGALGAAMATLFDEQMAILEDPEPSPERASRKKELVMQMDFDAMRPTGERARWAAYLASLDGRVAEGDITEAQHQRFLEIWESARRQVPRLRRPVAGRSDQGRLTLSWAFVNVKGVTFTIDIERDGRVDWFYRNAADGQVSGTEDEPEDELPEEAVLLLAAFAS